ncbi:MAG: selenide, water dikinase SelD [Proteobacteria bacterium]|nr:MAG: selenide, water dikinase SelD [Pseudomonadota bacterium]
MKLTQTVQKGGCAAKVAASELRKILGGVKFPPKPAELLVDGSLFDDAAIFQVSEELALVQTLDFFTPIVDSPAWFGKVAAANALSDVYAMGGVPKTALAILAFPVATMDNETVQAVLQGGCDLLAEAGVPLAGGHSIDDDTLKFGLSVTGYVNPKRMWTNAGAKDGDVLILTKALGTGTVTAALKRSEITEEEMPDVLASMAQLNNAGELLGDLSLAIHAATDVTGFGLAGHASQMARASKVEFAIDAETLPSFAKALPLLAHGFLTKAHTSNREYTADYLRFEDQVSKERRLLCFDPQTSGGLLLSVDPSRAEAVLAKLRERFKVAARIGKVLSGERPGLVIR